MSPAETAAAVVVGAGPAGIGAAVELARRGIRPVLLIERRETLGGIPALYRTRPGGVPTFVLWTRGRILFGEQFAARLAARLRGTGVEVWPESQVIQIAPRTMTLTVINPLRGRVDLQARAVVLACGARERTPAERGWIAGSRPGRVLFTKNLLDLAERNDLRTADRSLILGSDLLAYAAAAKLREAGAAETVMVDRRKRPDCSLPARLYFARWTRPAYHSAAQVRLSGRKAISGVELPDGRQLPCGRLILSGDLAPNSELALMAGLAVELPSRRPVVRAGYQLSEPGWFAAGNMLGGSRGAEWCYRNGVRVAACVAHYLSGAPG